MHRRRRFVLTAALLLVAGTAMAQGLGFGLGFEDASVMSHRGGPPAAHSFLLIDTGSAFLIDTGSKLEIQ